MNTEIVMLRVMPSGMMTAELLVSVDDRMLLLEEIWDSIAADPESVPITDEQKADLQARLGAYKDLTPPHFTKAD